MDQHGINASDDDNISIYRRLCHFAADSEEYTYADGYLVTEPVKGTAYAFNFQNKDSEIYDTSKKVLIRK